MRKDIGLAIAAFVLAGHAVVAVCEAIIAAGAQDWGDTIWRCLLAYGLGSLSKHVWDAA